MLTVSPNIDSMLAKRLRGERESRGWTLVELAARSGVSRAMISKIERGEVSPTAALLSRLCGPLELTLSRLFAQPDIAPPEHQVARVAEQPLWRDPETGFLRRSLSPPGQGPLELVWGELPPEAELVCPAARPASVSDRQLVVISGELSVKSGSAVNALGPGDCLRFGSPEGSEFRNSGAARCRFVVAMSRPAQPGESRRPDGAPDQE